MLKLKVQYLGHLTNSQLIGKDPDSGKYWWQEEKGVKQDEVVGCHQWLNGMSFNKLKEIVKDREDWSTAQSMASHSDKTEWLINNRKKLYKKQSHMEAKQHVRQPQTYGIH